MDETEKDISGNENYGYVMPPQEKKEEAPEIGIIRELSPKKVLEQLRMNIKGWYWNYEEDKWEKVIEKPLLNDKGISKYLSIVGSVITDLLTFSNYREDEINRYVLFVCEKAIPVIHINYKEYGILEKSDLQIVDIQLFNLTMSAFKKAVGAGDRNVIRGTVSEQIASRMGYGYPVQMSRKERRGFLSKVNPFS